MNLPQTAGMAVVVLVVAAFDLPVGWLMPLAIFCGAITNLVVAMWVQAR